MKTLKDEKYRPAFIKTVLEDPPLMPGQTRESFIGLFEEMELTQSGQAQSEREYMMVLQATKLTNEVRYCTWMKSKIMRMYQREAVTSLIFECQDFVGNPSVAGTLMGVAQADTKKFYLDASFKDKSLKKMEAIGFGPDAIEVKAFVLSLGVLAQLDAMIAKAEKRLMKFLEQIETSFASRAKDVRQVATEAIKQAATKE